MIDVKKCLELRSQGKTLQEIGDEFGVTRERIRQKIGPTTHLKRNYLKKEVKKLRDQNKTIKEINEILGVGSSTMAKLVGKGWKSNLKVAPKGYKRCYRCKRNILLKDFYENSHSCIECTKKRIAEYLKERRPDYKEQYKNNKDKAKARQCVNRYVKLGRLIKGDCELKDEKCRGRIEAHHYLGYEKEHQLDVKWYCSYHHRHIDGLTWGRKHTLDSTI